jgi:hypothetical protein
LPLSYFLWLLLLGHTFGETTDENDFVSRARISVIAELISGKLG